MAEVLPVKNGVTLPPEMSVGWRKQDEDAEVQRVDTTHFISHFCPTTHPNYMNCPGKPKLFGARLALDSQIHVHDRCICTNQFVSDSKALLKNDACLCAVYYSVRR